MLEHTGTRQEHGLNTGFKILEVLTLSDLSQLQYHLKWLEDKLQCLPLSKSRQIQDELLRNRVISLMLLQNLEALRELPEMKES